MGLTLNLKFFPTVALRNEYGTNDICEEEDQKNGYANLRWLVAVSLTLAGQKLFYVHTEELTVCELNSCVY